MLRIAVVGITAFVIVVISVVAIIMSTTKGSEWSESVWKSNEEGDDEVNDA